MQADYFANADPVGDFSEKAGMSVQKFSKRRKPPYDCVMMLKILILQSLYNLSDDETEYQVTDRLSFQKFLGIGPEDPVSRIQ